MPLAIESQINADPDLGDQLVADELNAIWRHWEHTLRAAKAKDAPGGSVKYILALFARESIAHVAIAYVNGRVDHDTLVASVRAYAGRVADA